MLCPKHKVEHVQMIYTSFCPECEREATRPKPQLSLSNIPEPCETKKVSIHNAIGRKYWGWNKWEVEKQAGLMGVLVAKTKFGKTGRLQLLLNSSTNKVLPSVGEVIDFDGTADRIQPNYIHVDNHEVHGKQSSVPVPYNHAAIVLSCLPAPSGYQFYKMRILGSSIDSIRGADIEVRVPLHRVHKQIYVGNQVDFNGKLKAMLDRPYSRFLTINDYEVK